MKKTKFYILLIVILALSCKEDNTSEVSSENGIDQSVSKMWNEFTKVNPKFKENELPDSWFFHNNEKDADRLAKLVLNGKKKAASSLYSWYKDAGADLQEIGTKHIITDFNGKALAIIEIKNVDTIPFKKISKTYAQLDMGTDIEPLKEWKKAHWDFFAETLKESGKTPSEDMLVVCEWFELIWPRK